jgi:type I restriction enzyme S subunit
MSWLTVKLGDVMTVGRGSSPRPIKDERFFIGGTIPWVKIADATASGKFIYQTNQHVNDYGASFSRKLKPGSLIFPASGTLGIPRFLGVEACIHDGWLYFSDYTGIEPEWLYYRLILLKSYYEGIAYGAAIQNINTDIVRGTEIQLPDIDTQHAIASVLCTYDDLIDTNKRRIQLLEDAGQRLYREWFVHLRYPGHVSKPVKVGTPAGWAKLPLGDLAEITMGQSPESKHYNSHGDGLPFHQGVSDFGERFVTHQTFTTQATRVAEAGDILCSVRAPVGRLNVTRDKIAIGRGLSAMRSRGGHQSLLFYQLKALFFAEDMIGGGAIFASVGKKELFGQVLLQPDDYVAAEFNRLASDIDAQIDALEFQNRRLALARDLLLPKLMSGQLDVSGMMLPEEAAA